VPREGTGVGPQAKNEYLAAMRDRCVRAQGRKEKSGLLAEAVSVTGYHRKAVIRAWRRPERLRPGPATEGGGIQFMRGRPYKKDDNAHVEQKNWTHVRKRMGYLRYDSSAAVEAMNDVYADLRLLQNLFLPSVKLQSKERVCARLRRRYGSRSTPFDRVRACPQADRAKVAASAVVARPRWLRVGRPTHRTRRPPHPRRSRPLLLR
jgi:hypothetical protein